jgi:hypothetical protein
VIILLGLLSAVGLRLPLASGRSAATAGAFDPFALFPPGVPIVETFWDHIADLELVIGAGLIILFSIGYGAFFKWWQTRAGRAILFVFIAMSFLLVQITLTKWNAGDYTGRSELRALVYFLLPGSLCYLFYALVRNFLFGPQHVTIEHRPIPSRRPKDHSSDIPIDPNLPPEVKTFVDSDGNEKLPDEGGYAL